MRAVTLRSFMGLHTWVGITTGLLLFIAFYAGALTVFHEELEQWEQPLPVTATQLDPSRAQALVDALLKAHPGAAAEFRLTLGTDHGEAPTVSWRSRRADGAQKFKSAELGPAGTFVEQSPKNGFSKMVYRLHFTAGLPDPWGTYLFGFVCVLYGLALVSGIVIHAPVLLRDLFALRPGRNLKRFWQDAHNLGGLLSLPFHIIFAWSGAVLAIGTLMLAPFQFFVFDGKLIGLIGADVGLSAPAVAAGVPAPLIDVGRALSIAQARVPGMAPTRLHYESAGDLRSVITVEGESAQQRMSHRVAVTLDGTQGSVRRVVDPARSSTGQTFLYGLYALHFGDYGGAPVRWLYLFLGLVGALVFFTGNLLWIEARRRHRAPVQRTDCIRMAQLTLGVSLGCVGGIAAMALATRVAPAVGIPLDVEAVYWSAFAAALICAFACKPARAAFALLCVLAVLHAAIAITDWWLAPAAWVVHLVPDLASLGLAAAFALMARAARRRGKNGETGSVWAAT